MNSDYLFVYGTLMRQFNNPFAEYLKSYSNFVGNGYIEGKMYLVEDDFLYPAAIYKPGIGHTVKGEIMRLNHPEVVLAELDIYEGIDTATDVQPYLKKKVEVYGQNKIYLCVTYVYNWPVDKLVEISSGDFLDAIREN